MTRRVEQTADDRRTGMTLAEMDAFVRNAISLGIPITAPVAAVTSVRGRIKALRVK